MKKYLLILLLAVFIIPSIAFASWWNPLTWKVFDFFRKSEVNIEQPVVIPSIIPNTINIDNKEVKTPKVIEKKKTVIPTTISTTPIPQVISTPTIVPVQPQPTLTKSEIDELKEMIDNLNTKVNNLEKKNNAVEEQVNKLVKFKPEVILDKKVIDNNGSDQIQIKIRTINDDGTIVPNKKIEITTSTGSDGGHKETKTDTITSDSDGNATYNTPTTTAYDRCGVFMSITVKIDNNFVFGQTLSVHNTKQVQSGGAACS